VAEILASLHESARAALGEGPVSLTSDSAAARAESGPLCCVADARIDNVAELAARFGMARQTTPAALILTLYRAHGADCADLLEGDFAFVLWDAARKRLIGARDRFGVKPLYLAEDRQGLFVASDPGRLPARFRDDPADATCAAYLAGLPPDGNSTFFAGITRLPPASLFVREQGETRTRCYWRLEARPGIAEPLTAQAEQLRHILDRSVKKRLAGADAPGTLLSGGLDSSSVACLLRDSTGGPVPSFSLVHSQPALSEKSHIDAVLAQGGFAPRFFDGAQTGPFDGVPALLAELHEPFLAPNLAAMRPLFAAARERGVDVLFDGHGGDEVVSHGFELLPRLAQEGRWLALWQALAASDSFGQSRALLFLLFLRSQKRGRSRWLTTPLVRLLDRGPRGAKSSPLDFLDPGFARQTGLPDRIGAMRRERHAREKTDQGRHLAQLTNPIQAYAFEVLDRLNRAAGIEGRYPFWDRELVEFCLSLPAEAKLGGGWSRLVLRRAMAPLLPPSVTWRRDKIDFSQAILHGMIADRQRTVDHALSGRALEALIDLPRARETWRRMVRRPDRAEAQQVQAIWRFAVFATWIELRGQSAVPPQSLSKELAA